MTHKEIETTLMVPKQLQKLKDYAQSHVFDPVPANLTEYWIEVLWLKGMLLFLNANGYEVRKKDAS